MKSVSKNFLRLFVLLSAMMIVPMAEASQPTPYDFTFVTPDYSKIDGPVQAVVHLIHFRPPFSGKVVLDVEPCEQVMSPKKEDVSVSPREFCFTADKNGMVEEKDCEFHLTFREPIGEYYVTAIIFNAEGQKVAKKSRVMFVEDGKFFRGVDITTAIEQKIRFYNKGLSYEKFELMLLQLCDERNEIWQRKKRDLAK